MRERESKKAPLTLTQLEQAEVPPRTQLLYKHAHFFFAKGLGSSKPFFLAGSPVLEGGASAPSCSAEAAATGALAVSR